MILSLVLLGCSKETKKNEESKENEVVVPLISEHSEGKNPIIQFEQVHEKHLEIMLSAYQELNTYYEGVLNTDVKQVRFVGKSSPWKPQADGHYCIDVRSPDSSKTEHIYYFANYCRSLSTLLRETSTILYSYVDIQTCEDLCSCVMEKGLRLSTRIDEKNVRCTTYCKSLGLEVTCSNNGSDLKNKCCVQQD